MPGLRSCFHCAFTWTPSAQQKHASGHVKYRTCDIIDNKSGDYARRIKPLEGSGGLRTSRSLPHRLALHMEPTASMPKPTYVNAVVKSMPVAPMQLQRSSLWQPIVQLNPFAAVIPLQHAPASHTERCVVSCHTLLPWTAVSCVCLCVCLCCVRACCNGSRHVRTRRTQRTTPSHPQKTAPSGQQVVFATEHIYWFEKPNEA